MTEDNQQLDWSSPICPKVTIYKLQSFTKLKKVLMQWFMMNTICLYFDCLLKEHFNSMFTSFWKISEQMVLESPCQHIMFSQNKIVLQNRKTNNMNKEKSCAAELMFDLIEFEYRNWTRRVKNYFPIVSGELRKT